MLNSIKIIAEVKTESPFGFKADLSWDKLFEIADEIGDIISIHTDTRWGGSYNLLKKARTLTSKPLLAKGFHYSDLDIKRAIAYGADLVLVVGRVPNVYADQCLIEPLSFDEIKHLPEDIHLVWNARDLRTGHKKNETITDVRKIWHGWLCQASLITQTEDINPTVQAALIGEHLPLFRASYLQSNFVSK
jgi:hypothetical protein